MSFIIFAQKILLIIGVSYRLVSGKILNTYKSFSDVDEIMVPCQFIFFYY